jgi:hypothetical protein
LHKLVYASAVMNSITSTDNKLECIQLKSAALYFNRFFHHIHYSCAYALEQLKLYTLYKRRYHLGVLFLIQIYLVSKFCTSLLETVGL